MLWLLKGRAWLYTNSERYVFNSGLSVFNEFVSHVRLIWTLLTEIKNTLFRVWSMTKHLNPSKKLISCLCETLLATTLQILIAYRSMSWFSVCLVAWSVRTSLRTKYLSFKYNGTIKYLLTFFFWFCLKFRFASNDVSNEPNFAAFVSTKGSYPLYAIFVVFIVPVLSLYASRIKSKQKFLCWFSNHI